MCLRVIFYFLSDDSGRQTQTISTSSYIPHILPPIQYSHICNMCDNVSPCHKWTNIFGENGKFIYANVVHRIHSWQSFLSYPWAPSVYIVIFVIWKLFTYANGARHTHTHGDRTDNGKVNYHARTALIYHTLAEPHSQTYGGHIDEFLSVQLLQSFDTKYHDFEARSHRFDTCAQLS